MKTTALYGRVSTERQKEEKTIDSQVAELRELAQRKKLRIYDEYLDKGYSGTVLDRPALDRLMCLRLKVGSSINPLGS